MSLYLDYTIRLISSIDESCRHAATEWGLEKFSGLYFYNIKYPNNLEIKIRKGKLSYLLFGLYEILFPSKVGYH